MKLQTSIIVILLIIISCSAFIPSKISVSIIHSHPNDRIVALAESKEDLKAGELWKVERVDHISDYGEEIGKTYSPLSLKDNVPSSWFVGATRRVRVRYPTPYVKSKPPGDLW